MPRTKSLRQYGPNFQRFYCEMDANGTNDIIVDTDSYYRKRDALRMIS